MIRPSRGGRPFRDRRGSSRHLRGGEGGRGDERDGALEPRVLAGRDENQLRLGGRGHQHALGEGGADGLLEKSQAPVISPLM